MKFGIREICDVVLKAKTAMIVGQRTFEKDEPVIYFDTAKTSTLESSAATVYAQGGRGNSRLIAWEGDKVLTFTMEDALLSPLGFAILSGAGLFDASASEKMNVHTTTQVSATVATEGSVTVDLSEALDGGTLNTDFVYGMLLGADGEVISSLGKGVVTTDSVEFTNEAITVGTHVILVDYYIEKTSGVTQLEVTPDKFAGNFYLEASTLFRRQSDGVDLPAEFVIPNVKIQSNFTFAMAGTGDPSTFTFVMDAFPDYTKFNKTRKVLCALQIIA